MSEIALKTCNTCNRKFMTPDEFLSNTSRWRICDQGHLWFNCSCHSTGIIIKGKFDWYNPAHSLSAPAQSIFNRISRETELPRLPNYVMQLQKMLEDPASSTEKMAEVIKHDLLLATTVLRIANNQKTRDGQQIHSLSHAIAFIGIESLRDMVIVAAVSRFELKTKVFSAKTFWNNSFLTGRIAEYLVNHLQLTFSLEQVFMAGSTCNIGKIVQAIIDPKIADLYTMEMEDLSLLGDWSAAEKRNKGYDHSVLGEIGAAFWGFPEELLDSIAMHHVSPLLAKTKAISLWEVTGFANQLCHWVTLDAHQVNQELFQHYLRRFYVNEAMLDTIIPALQHLKHTQITV
ncbi:MAG: HDOD domain-containing protein [Chitinophagaceae bacterium]|nr:HDOD domain-containing protein [Oligoflexus sp.]